MGMTVVKGTFGRDGGATGIEVHESDSRDQRSIVFDTQQCYGATTISRPSKLVFYPVSARRSAVS